MKNIGNIALIGESLDPLRSRVENRGRLKLVNNLAYHLVCFAAQDVHYIYCYKIRCIYSEVTKFGRFVKKELLITSISFLYPAGSRGRSCGGFKSAVPDPPLRSEYP